MQSVKKSKFSVTPFQPESNTSIGTSSRQSARNDQGSLPRKPTLSRDNSIISGLDRIQEDVFGGQAESRSELQPLTQDQPEVLPRVSMSSLHPKCATERYSRSAARTPATTRATHRPSAFEASEDYFGSDKENGRRESGSSSSFGVRNSVRPSFQQDRSNLLYQQPPGEDIYQIFRAMENKLDTLRNVIQMQKGRLHGGASQGTGDSIIQRPSRITRQDSKILMRSSRSEYLRRL